MASVLPESAYCPFMETSSSLSQLKYHYIIVSCFRLLLGLVVNYIDMQTAHLIVQKSIDPPPEMHI